MIEVCRNLFVGSEQDEASIRGQGGWFVIHACKEPYHRDALGYGGRAASNTHPEYLLAKRDGRLILNLVDVPDVRYISPVIVDAALEAIAANIAASKVLVHCNQGQSRSPSIAILYLARHSAQFASLDHDAAVAHFRTIYPSYAPARGMADFVRIHWGKYAGAAIS